MYPSDFEYLVPASLSEAVSMLEMRKGEAKILAGGHTLIPLMKLRLAKPTYLIDIGHIEGLASIRREGDVLLIGPMTTHHAIETSELVGQVAALLAETAARIGDLQVRNRGTIGGSLAHADPNSDLPAALLALEAEFKAVGPKGERRIKASEFFVDLLTSDLGEDEVLAEVRVPILHGRVGSAYLKFDNPASHYAIVGVAALLALAPDDRIVKARVGITRRRIDAISGDWCRAGARGSGGRRVGDRSGCRSGGGRPGGDERHSRIRGVPCPPGKGVHHARAKSGGCPGKGTLAQHLPADGVLVRHLDPIAAWSRRVSKEQG
ncbi:MAG TPA: FAD binding domain-containing protein [Roseiflexaceae bacterium]|jgi:carbon-monoxide dehydrogenase medium subunit